MMTMKKSKTLTMQYELAPKPSYKVSKAKKTKR
jgi:hypothetical protein